MRFILAATGAAWPSPRPNRRGAALRALTADARNKRLPIFSAFDESETRLACA